MQLATDLKTKVDFAVIQFTDGQHAKLCAGSFFAKSDDGGVTWTKKEFPARLRDIHFLNNNLGYLVTDLEIHRTTDGGNNWVRVCKIANAVLVEVHFSDANNGWACGTNKTILQWKQ